jgi:6-phosphogluconolactonase
MGYIDLKFDSKEDFIQYAGDKMLIEMMKVIKAKGSVNIAISGGRTPLGVFKYWLYSDFNRWQDVNFYWVDERFVSLQHNDNNAHNAIKILGALPIGAFHRIDTSLKSAVVAATAYDEFLKKILPIFNGVPYFDIMQLGMGDDGHTGSLFPNTAVLEEMEKAVASVFVASVDTHRVTLTYSTIINSGKKFIFIGADRESIYKKIQMTNVSYKDFPIKKIMMESTSTDEYLYF